MKPTDRPDRETLLLFVSAFFDGELSAVEEAQLFEAMGADPALEAEFLAMERSLGATAELAGLADAVLAQVAPEAAGLAALPALASALADDEADAAQRARFEVLAADEQAARQALSFLHAAEGVGHVIEALPESPAVLAALAPVPAAVSARIAADERAAELLLALCDDEVQAAERAELSHLVTAGAAPSLAFMHLAEAVSVVVGGPASDPAAARAGAAALQVLAAEQQQQRPAAAQAAAPAGPSWGERVRSGFSGLFAPLAAAACAAALFVALQGPPAASGDAGEHVVPPEEWARAFLPSLDEELLAAASPEDIEVLGDNGGTEVQAIDSGSHVAAVFSTEASSITVIWVPEPSESGT